MDKIDINNIIFTPINLIRNAVETGINRGYNNFNARNIFHVVFSELEKIMNCDSQLIRYAIIKGIVSGYRTNQKYVESNCDLIGEFIDGIWENDVIQKNILENIMNQLNEVIKFNE